MMAQGFSQARDTSAAEQTGQHQNRSMDMNLALPLLGGLSPAVFMRRYWQKKPLLVRQAWPGVAPPLTRAALFDLAVRDDVESRLVKRSVQRSVKAKSDGWQVRPGPLPRRALPPVSRPLWTLLVQGLDLHVPAAHDMLRAFRFVPDARLDDVMVSWASPGGGVGAHVDAYDVFLLQVQGQRRWRIGRCKDQSFVPGAPLKLLLHFEPTQEWLLSPGDMLYLPPGWGHDGVADDDGKSAGAGQDCMTCSIGFRAPAAHELARELLLRLADDIDEGAIKAKRYGDPQQPATATPAAVPEALLAFAKSAVAQQLADAETLPRLLGEILSEPKPQTWFEGGSVLARASAVVLDPRTKMLYDARHVFINGEALRAGGRDATLMRRLADSRGLSASDCGRLSAEASGLLADWIQAGWVHQAQEQP
jgi:50S ribosomal protein L16 3-hydroxylase